MKTFQSSQLYIQCPMEFQFILLISEIALQIKIITRDQTQERDGLGYQNLSVLRDGLTPGKLHYTRNTLIIQLWADFKTYGENIFSQWKYNSLQ